MFEDTWHVWGWNPHPSGHAIAHCQTNGHFLGTVPLTPKVRELFSAPVTWRVSVTCGGLSALCCCNLRSPFSPLWQSGLSLDPAPTGRLLVGHLSVSLIYTRRIRIYPTDLGNKVFLKATHTVDFSPVFLLLVTTVMGLPRWLSGKESANAGDGVRSLGREDPLEKAVAIHISIPTWKIPWTEEPGGLQSLSCKRVGHHLAT